MNAVVKPSTNLSIHLLAEEALTECGGDLDKAKELLGKKIHQHSDCVLEDAISVAVNTLIGWAVNHNRHKVYSGSTPEYQYDEKDVRKMPPQDAPTREKSGKETTQLRPRSSPEWRNKADELERVWVAGIHIRALTAQHLRDSIASDQSASRSFTKSAQYKTELLKLIKPNKTLGQSATDTDILRIVRRYT